MSTARSSTPRAGRLLPLKPLVFQILLALADGERHGWSLVREVQQRGEFARIIEPYGFSAAAAMSTTREKQCAPQG